VERNVVGIWDFKIVICALAQFHVEQKENKVNSENRLKRFAENNKTKWF